MFVQDEVRDAGNAEGEDIANQYIPSAGEAFDQQQCTHLNQERLVAKRGNIPQRKPNRRCERVLKTELLQMSGGNILANLVKDTFLGTKEVIYQKNIKRNLKLLILAESTQSNPYLK